MAQAPTETLIFRISEALPKDVGRGIARLDPNDMATLELQAGDIVRILGKRATAAKVVPALIEDRGKSIVQMDGIIRENAQVSLGDKVQLQKADYADAKTIVLAAVNPTSASFRENDGARVRRLLEGLALVPGDKVRVTIMGARHQEFSVVDASPVGVVLISPSTVVKIRGESVSGKEKTGVTYEDVGGLHREIQRIREMIELPLKHPELFERLGIDAPKGVLLHGPPGCGKTMIARAVADETDASFFHISGPEIIHKFYGESEAHLRAVFEKAGKNAPAIVFLDEIDAIASKREDIRGDQQVEKRVVAQLLALMDGLESRGQVMVIGATNIPQVLDPALRRPGRFDREIAIGVPDKRGRLEILQIHTRGMPLTSDVDLERTAEITHGFVGADLEALCREAAMTALRRMLPKLDLDADLIPYEMLLELEVKMDDFQGALKEVEPSALREVFTEVPDVGWRDIGGLEEAKRVLMEAIEWPMRYPDVFKQANASPPKGILLSGPPGTGKTLLAKAVAKECGANFISIKGPALLSKWVGESEKGIREIFKKARQASPCIVFFDEIDAIAPSRGSGGDSHVGERVVSQLLTELDGIEELRGVVVLAATNRPDIIDPALLRPGRFDRQMELPAPDKAARLEIFKIHTLSKPLADDVDLDRQANATDGLVGADISGICQRASMLAIREFIDSLSGTPTPEGLALLKVAARHFEQAISAVKSSKS